MNTDELTLAFVAEVGNALAQGRTVIERLTKDRGNPADLFELMRFFHNIKSSSAMMGFQDLSQEGAKMEEFLKTINQSKATVTAEQLAACGRAMDGIEQALKTLGK